MVLVNRFKQYLYRIVRDPATQVDDITKYKMGEGLAGMVTICSQMVKTEDTYKDHRFSQELDDPNFSPGLQPVTEMISVPIFA